MVESPDIKKVSILIPCYNEEENVVQVAAEVEGEFTKNLEAYDYEIVFIDNASTDDTRRLLREICAKNNRIKAIFNCANFRDTSGLHGLLQTSGDCAICIPADFQVPVYLITELVKLWENGEKIAVAIKTSSDENKIMWMIRSFFYWFISQFAQAPFLHHFTGFGIIYDRTMIELVRKLKNPQLFSRAFVSELNPARLYFNQPKRRAGRSKSDIKHLFNTALLLLTQSTKIGSRVALFVGTIVSAISALVGLVYLIMKLLFWSSFPAGIIPLTIGVFFLGSIQIFFIGLLGEYVTAINEKLDARPYAIEAERINFDEPERPERVPF